MDVRLLVIRTAWKSNARVVTASPQVPEAKVSDLLRRNPDGWGVGNLFDVATLGEWTILEPEVVDVGPLDLVVTTDVRKDSVRRVVIAAAVAKLPAAVDLLAYDGVVVWIDAPCDAGAAREAITVERAGRRILLNAALLDPAGDLTFYAHEIGHVLGYRHSNGPAVRAMDANRNPLSDPTGAPLLTQVYRDPSCLMSAKTFGGQNPTTRISRVPSAGTGSGIPLWDAVAGPLPSAAMSYVWCRDGVTPVFGDARHVAHVTSWASGPVTVRLYPLAATPHDSERPVLAVWEAEGSTWFAEQRTQEGWDAGLQTAGVQIRRWRKLAMANPIAEPGPEYLATITAAGDQDWTSPSGSFTVLVEHGPETEGMTRWADVTISPSRGVRSVRLVSDVRDGPDQVIRTSRVTLDDPCMAGTYTASVVGRDRDVTLRALATGMDDPTFTWQIAGHPLTPVMPLGGIGVIPGADGVPTSAQVALRDVWTTGATLHLVVSFVAGDVTLPLTCTAQDGRGAESATLDLTLTGTRITWDQQYLDRFRTCVEAQIPWVQGPVWNHDLGPSDGPDFARLKLGLERVGEGAGRQRLVELSAQRLGVPVRGLMPGG